MSALLPTVLFGCVGDLSQGEAQQAPGDQAATAQQARGSGPRVVTYDLDLLHGAFHTGQVWDSTLDVLRSPAFRASLRQGGIEIGEIMTPTLAGMVTDAMPDAWVQKAEAVDLDTQIGRVEDELRGHRNVVLFAHSFAGMVSAGVLRDAASPHSHLDVVGFGCLECAVPSVVAPPAPPQSFFDVVMFDPTQSPPPQLSKCSETSHFLNPFQARLWGLVVPTQINAVSQLERCQPIATFAEPLGGFDPAHYTSIPSFYWATNDNDPEAAPWFAAYPFTFCAQRAQQYGMTVGQVYGPHDVMVPYPDRVARLIAQVLQAVRARDLP
jgi:hypothetical protein